MTQSIHVILVENDYELRERLVGDLTIAGFNLRAVVSGLEFYQSLAATHFDVAVINIDLPDQSGFVLIEYARKNTPIGLIAISQKDSIDDRITGYQSGSDLFLNKSVDSRELTAAITNIAARQRERLQNSIQSDVWILKRIQRVLTTPAGSTISLTSKEYHLLDLLISTPGETVVREKLLQCIYNDTSDYTSRALDSLVRRLRKKASQLIASEPPISTAYGQGYCFSAPAQLR